MTFTLIFSEPFLHKLASLPAHIRKQADKTLEFLANNPLHPSLKTHKVQNSHGFYGGDVFEAYVTIKYRLTWEYGPNQGEITLRNIDNHDECLKKA